MAVKRKLEFEPSELQEPTDIITVHGVLMSVSPVSTGKNPPFRKYFMGKLTDGKKVMQLVSFNSHLHTEIQRLCKKHTPTALGNLAVKQAVHSGSEYELITSPKRTTVENSKWQFSLGHIK